MPNGLDMLAIIGLLLGAVFGLAGSLVPEAAMRALFWGIDGAGLVMAASLLAVRYFRLGKDIVAAGFLVFAIGEGIVLSSAAAPLDGSGPVFAAGTALWATALFLTSGPREFAPAFRVLGAVAGTLFAVTALMILSGAGLTPLTQPLPFFAYPVFVLTLLGWVWTLIAARRREGL
jgi:hypothetical protein